MKDLVANLIMTVALFPLSMFGVWLYMKFSHDEEKDKTFYWWTVVAAYAVMLFVCWGIETGYLYKFFTR